VHVEGGQKRLAVFGVAVAAMEFACDPVDQTIVDAFAQGALLHDGQAPWLLVDAALLEDDNFESRVRAQGWSSHSALATSPLAAFGKQAPQIVQLVGPVDAIVRGVSALTRLGRHAPAFSMLHSSASLEELQHLFAHLAYAVVDDDMPVHCRFADTRVLPSLLSVLLPAQATRVRQVVPAWRWWDRQNTMRQWPDSALKEQPKQSAVADEAEQLQLNAQQFAAMLDAAEADGVFMQLLDTTPELVPATQRGHFHQRLVKQLAQATERGVTQAPDRLQFVVLSLSCGDQFHQHAALQATWKAVSQDNARLSDVMATWDDALWDALSPKTEAAA
jgi:hypothetical protein